VNLSLTPETSVNESGASFTYYKFAPIEFRPKVIVGVRLNLANVMDLANLHSSKARPWLRLDELLAEDWRKTNDAGRESQSQALGRAAHDVGAEALLVPSARVKTCANLVFFPESLFDASKAEILGQDELRRWIKK
jgi:hypothetical protein